MLLVGAAVLALHDAGLAGGLTDEAMEVLRLRRVSGPLTEITPDPTVQ